MSDLVSGLAWMTVGVVFCIGAVGLGLGSLDEPGPGFFPFWMSVSLITFSSIHLVSSLLAGRRHKSSIDEPFWPKSDGRRRILLTIIFLFIFVFALNYLGFILTTTLFMIFLLKFVETKRWFIVLLVVGMTTGLSYAIFRIWLKVSLPTGLLGF